MAGIANDVKQIRQALYGREVREAIAHGIEQCYSDVMSGKTIAETAAQQADSARDRALAVINGLEIASDSEVRQELGIT